MKKRSVLRQCLALAGVLLASATLQASQQSSEELPPLLDPKTDKPGLSVGDRVPADITVFDAEGNEVALNDKFTGGMTVVMFYRGGWCPYCSKAMAQWGRELGRFEERNVRVIAISPETGEHLLESKAKQRVGFDVYVDKTTEAMRHFKVAFQVDEDYTKMLRNRLKVELGSWNASGEEILPAPATFLIDEQGVVQWVHADWDYKRRANPDDIFAILRDYE
ncbi:MAG: peroxiredoxin-like family protein [Planctomycetota bacterium]|jgi:peroxiredoxin